MERKPYIITFRTDDPEAVGAVVALLTEEEYREVVLAVGWLQDFGDGGYFLPRPEIQEANVSGVVGCSCSDLVSTMRELVIRTRYVDQGRCGEHYLGATSLFERFLPAVRE